MPREHLHIGERAVVIENGAPVARPILGFTQDGRVRLQGRRKAVEPREVRATGPAVR